MDAVEVIKQFPEEYRLQVAELLEAKERAIRRNRLEYYDPYPFQRTFHAAGKDHRERLLIAANQVGKTLSGAAEMAIHLSGQYPDWWEGRVFKKPIVAIAGSESTELTRDGVQKQLIGPPDDEEEWGTGFIPQRSIVSVDRRLGVANALDTVTVQHSSGGKSTLLFKSYDQKRRKWQANTCHVVWFDEEPDEEIYNEGLTRTNATGGMVYLTFTPIKGHSTVVDKFIGAEGDAVL